MPLDIQYDILNDTPATASPVDANFNRIEQYTNQELVSRDGTVAMVAQLKLVGDPVSALDAAPKQYVDQILPVGIIMMYGGAAAPPGGRWALCNGAELETTVYVDLYAVIAKNFTPAETPAGRFNLPDYSDRFPMGRGAVAAVGAKGGSANAVVPTHSHDIAHSHPAGSSGWDGPDHSHGGVDHLHRVDIWSGGQNTGHYHQDQGHGMYVFHGPDGGNGAFSTSTTGGRVLSTSPSTNWANTDHAHPINGWSGAADRSLQTGGASARHVHTTSTPAHAGRSGTEGVAVTNTNLPPYVGVSYIIRIT